MGVYFCHYEFVGHKTFSTGPGIRVIGEIASNTSHNFSYHVVSHGCTLCELDMYHYSIGLSVWTSLASIITQ